MVGSSNFVSAIIVAGGSGSRAGGRKQFVQLGPRTVLGHGIAAVLSAGRVGETIVVVPPAEADYVSRELLPWELAGSDPDKIGDIKVVGGGDTRQASVRAGLDALSPESDIVMVHDAARPFVEAGHVVEVLEAAIEGGGAVLGVCPSDTIKRIYAREGIVVDTFPRDLLFVAQTPQAFRTKILRDAHELAERDGFEGTDESSLVERLACGGCFIRAVIGSRANFKITTQEDLAIAVRLMEIAT